MAVKHKRGEIYGSMYVVYSEEFCCQNILTNRLNMNWQQRGWMGKTVHFVKADSPVKKKFQLQRSVKKKSMCKKSFLISTPPAKKKKLFYWITVVYIYLSKTRGLFIHFRNSILKLVLKSFLFCANTPPPNPCIYISIVIYRQICFVLSELISVARQYLPVAGIETRLTETPSQSF